MKDTSSGGVIPADLHGKNTYQAGITVDSLLKRAKSGTYRLRLIHGYHGGTAIGAAIVDYHDLEVLIGLHQHATQCGSDARLFIV